MREYPNERFPKGCRSFCLRACLLQELSCNKQECELSTEYCNTPWTGYPRNCCEGDRNAVESHSCLLLISAMQKCPLICLPSTESPSPKESGLLIDICPCSCGCWDLPVLVCVCASKSQSPALSCASKEGINA